MPLLRPVPTADPRSVRPFAPQRALSTPWVWQGGLLLLAVALTAYYTLRTDRNFWYDEAMLVQAMRLDGWLAPWQPMSHFEQASPWGVYLIQKLWLSAVGFQPDVLRLPGLAAYAVGGFAVWRAATLWFGGVSAVFTGVAALVTLDVVQTAGDFKHYVFEFAVSGLLLWLAARVVRSEARGRAVGSLFAVACISVLFSNTVVLVVPGVALAVALAVPPALRRVLGGLIVFAVVYAVWYLLAIRPSTVFQIAYPTYRETNTVDLYPTLVQAVMQPNSTYIVSLTGLAAAGVAAALIWRRRLLAPFVPATVAVVLGWVGVRVGLIPFSADRHVLFLVPLLALGVGASARVIADVVGTVAPVTPGHRTIVAALIAIVLALGATATIAPNAGTVRQQAGEALTTYRAQCPTFFVDWWTQPSTVLYAGLFGISDRIRGAVDTRSGSGQQAWAYRVMDAPAAYQTRLVSWIREHPSTCLLTGGRPDENGLVFEPLTRAGLTCGQFAVVAGIQLSRCRKESA